MKQLRQNARYIYQRIAVRQYWILLVTSRSSKRCCWGHLLFYTSWIGQYDKQKYNIDNHILVIHIAIEDYKLLSLDQNLHIHAVPAAARAADTHIHTYPYDVLSKLTTDQPEAGSAAHTALMLATSSQPHTVQWINTIIEIFVYTFTNMY